MKKVLLLLALLAVFLVSCASKQVTCYNDYVCYDFHLNYLSASGIVGESTVEKDSEEYIVKYRKIIDENPDEFIAAWVRKNMWGGYLPEPRVLQSPTTAVSVFDDWTVEKIQFCLGDQKYPSLEAEFPRKDEKIIISESNDSACIDEVRRFENYSGTGIIRDAIFGDEFRGTSFYPYIRLVFEESKNIVWEAEITSYRGEDGVRIIYINYGTVWDYYLMETKDVEIPADSALYAMISEGIEKALSDQMGIMKK